MGVAALERDVHHSETPVIAALDLGTNNCRLLVAKRTGSGSFLVIDAFSRIVRLGEGVARTNVLSEDAIDRTIAALKICARKIAQYPKMKLRSVATEACRRAENSAAFLARVVKETGIKLEVISAAEEAALAFRGTAPLLRPEIPYGIIFDIGGGSTELGWAKSSDGTSPEIKAWHSLKFGVVSMAEQFGADVSDRATALTRFEKMVGEVTENLQAFAHAIGARGLIRDGLVQMVGTSGTVTTLAGIYMNLLRYDRALVDGSYLEFSTLMKISRQLATQPCVQRASHPCIGKDRADLVVAGCAILVAICRLWPIGTLRVADRGVREGILTNLAMQP